MKRFVSISLVSSGVNIEQLSDFKFIKSSGLNKTHPIRPHIFAVVMNVLYSVNQKGHPRGVSNKLKQNRNLILECVLMKLHCVRWSVA